MKHHGPMYERREEELGIGTSLRYLPYFLYGIAIKINEDDIRLGVAAVFSSRLESEAMRVFEGRFLGNFYSFVVLTLEILITVII